jgi:hypothetical protein
MSWHCEIEQHQFSTDFNIQPIDEAADKRAALKVVKASIYLALCSAKPEEIFAAVDAAIMSYQ